MIFSRHGSQKLYRNWTNCQHPFDCETFTQPSHSCRMVAACCPWKSIDIEQSTCGSPTVATSWLCGHLEIGQIFFKLVYILTISSSSSSFLYVLLESETLKNLMMLVIPSLAPNPHPPILEDQQTWQQELNTKKWYRSHTVNAPSECRLYMEANVLCTISVWRLQKPHSKCTISIQSPCSICQICLGLQPKGPYSAHRQCKQICHDS